MYSVSRIKGWAEYRVDRVQGVENTEWIVYRVGRIQSG